jgi:hypothetical protein
MPIPGTSTNISQDIFYTEGFKVIVRSEKEYLLSQSSSVSLDKRYDVWACRNDFYKLLRNKNIPPYLYWVTAYLNGIEDPLSDITGMTYFMKVEEVTLAKIISRSNTVAG